MQKKIIDNLNDKHQVAVYYPEEEYFLSISYYLSLSLYNKYDYFIYLNDSYSLDKLLSLDISSNKILVFKENNQLNIKPTIRIDIIELNLFNNKSYIDLTLENYNLRELKINVMKLQRFNNVYNPNDLEIFSQYGYLMKNISNYIQYGLEKYSSKSIYKNILSLLPRSGIDIKLFSYIKNNNHVKYLDDDYYYEYNSKICVNLFFIDNTKENIESFLEIIHGYREILFSDLLDILLFLIKFTDLNNYLTIYPSTKRNTIVLLDRMMKHEKYETNNLKVKIILEEILLIDSLSEIASMYMAFYESEIENYKDAILKLQNLIKSNDREIALLSMDKLAYCKMMSREDLDYSKKTFRYLIKQGSKEQLGKLYNNLGLVYYYQGKYKKAKKIYKKCEMFLNFDNLLDKETSKYYNNLALIEMELGNYDYSEKIFKKLIENNIEIYGDYPLQYVSDEFDNLGIIYLYKNDYKNATDCFLNAMIRAETINSQLMSKENYLYSKAKENVESYIELNELLACCEQDVNTENMDKAQTFYMIGELYFDRNDYEFSLSYLERAYSLQRKYKLFLDSKLTKMIIDQIKTKKNNCVLKYIYFIKYRLYNLYYSKKYSNMYYLAVKSKETYLYIFNNLKNRMQNYYE